MIRHREIGSEFWDVPIIQEQNNLFPESIQWFLSGRSALQAIIKELKNCHTVAMPSWCCDSMVKPFIDAGIRVHFYHVYFYERLVEEIEDDSDVLFLMDYFGYTGKQPDLTGYKGIVIRDVTHSIFSSVYADADYYFGSLRKWCGVWTGGYAWKKDGHPLNMGKESSDDFGYVSLREKAMNLKNGFIHGWDVTDKGYLRIFDEAEDTLENVGIVPAADRDVELAMKLDVDFIKAQHRANAEVLMAAFPEWLIFPNLSSTDTPMFVPILIPNNKRDELWRYLINCAIYCPIHWPISEYHKLDKKAETIYMNEISLVCDQRYTEEDMYRMVDTIKAFMEV